MSGAALIVGGDGALGAALRAHLAVTKPKQEVRVTSRRNTAGTLPLDLADRDAVRTFDPGAGVGRAYLLAAVTSMRACREDPVGSAAINVHALSTFAHRLAWAGATVVMVSTNQVFDGARPWRAVDEPVSPVSAYGRQKAALERVVLGCGGVVVRPTKVVGPGAALPPALRRFDAALRDGQAVQAFGDLRFAPVRPGTVLHELTTAGPGVHHVSGDRDVSYADAARWLASRHGVDPSCVTVGSAASAGVPAEERPAFTTLAGGVVEPVWDVLAEALNQTMR